MSFVVIEMIRLLYLWCRGLPLGRVLCVRLEGLASPARVQNPFGAAIGRTWQLSKTRGARLVRAKGPSWALSTALSKIVTQTRR